MKPGQLNGVFIIAAVNLGIAMKNDKAKATQIRVKLLTRFMHSNEPVIERRKKEKITFNDFWKDKSYKKKRPREKLRVFQHRAI